MSVYKLFAGASYKAMEDKNFDEQEFTSVTELCLGMVKIITEDPLANTFTLMVSVSDDPPPARKPKEE